MSDPLAEELQIAMDALEAQMDPDDTEIQAYARACNRVQGDEDATTARYKIEREKLDANYAKMLSGFENHRKGIEYKWGQMIREKISAKLAGKKQKYVDTLFGRLGWRKTPAKVKRLYRDGCDKNTALKWAQDNDCKNAISTKETVIMSELTEESKQVWLEKVPAENKFYWKANPMKKKDTTDGN